MLSIDTHVSEHELSKGSDLLSKHTKKVLGSEDILTLTLEWFVLNLPERVLTISEAGLGFFPETGPALGFIFFSLGVEVLILEVVEVEVRLGEKLTPVLWSLAFLLLLWFGFLVLLTFTFTLTLSTFTSLLVASLSFSFATFLAAFTSLGITTLLSLWSQRCLA